MTSDKSGDVEIISASFIMATAPLRPQFNPLSFANTLRLKNINFRFKFLRSHHHDKHMTTVNSIELAEAALTI